MDPVNVGSLLTDSFGEVVSDLMASIGGILPIALTIFGAVLAVTFGMKFFKKVIGKS